MDRSYPLVTIGLLLGLGIAGGGCSEPVEDAAGATSDLVGGSKAAPGQFPSTLELSSRCTAAKVGPRKILTAAHCVADASGFAPDSDHSPGSHILVSNSVDGRNGRAVKIKKNWIHPSHRPHGSVGHSTVADVAVLELDEEWDSLTDIPDATIDIAPLAEDDPVVIMGYGCESWDGWGMSALKFHPTTVGTESLIALGAFDVADYRSSFWFTPIHDAGACPGDSGGPVYRGDGTSRRVVGINAWLPSDHRSSGHTRLDVASRYDIGSWLASITGVLVEGTPSDHYVECTDPAMLVCGAIAKARSEAGEETFGRPVSLPSWVSSPRGEVWQQDFFKKRVRVEPTGRVSVVDRASAQCEEKTSGSFCGADFGDDEPRSLFTCKDHAVESRVVCPERCGLGFDSSGTLSLGCQPK